ncbi:hypothetical protein N8I77_012033 [Diaporthe amygdali]|uniref:Zn(2)-C6 fungal-type domain-containing protein n=1 Tax=Phomopsis amygdali TaxID=1214568 RepID=A0AAD9S3W5_PHOAM|nr:hypothetical protein N8I77_012033 [Diaporthe amygdali]
MPAVGDQASTTGLSSRRSACDRCRGQKLGCLREGNDPSGRCDRCAKADAKCITTPIYHMRHYTIRDHDTGGRSTTRMSTTTNTGSAAMPSHKRRRHHNDNRDNRRQDQSPGQGQARSQAQLQVQTTSGTNSPGRLQSRPSQSPVSFTPGFATFEWPSLDAFGKSDQGATAGASSHVSSPEWSPMMDIVAGSAQLPPPQCGPTPRSQTTLATPGWDAGGLNLDDYLAGDFTHKNGSEGANPSEWPTGLRSSLASGAGADARHQVVPWPQAVQEGDILDQSSLGDLDIWGLGLPTSSNSTEETRYRLMEEIARINLELATQLRRMVKSPPDGTLKILIPSELERPGASGPATTTPLLGDILNSTRRYLDVLATATDSRPFPNPSPADFHHLLDAAAVPPLATIGNSIEASKMSRGQEAAVSPDTSSTSTSSSSSPSRASSTPPSSLSSVTKAPPDPSMVFLALVCYVHILRLHVAVFAHIRQYLELVADSDHGRMSPISGFCGFDECPLQSGNLQTTMFIQMVTNTFERMERLLGLPREFHIGTRDGGGTGGLLSGDGFLDVAKSMLRKEEVGRPEEGQGGIKYLRKTMKKAKRLLRDRIAP